MHRSLKSLIRAKQESIPSSKVRHPPQELDLKLPGVQLQKLDIHKYTKQLAALLGYASAIILDKLFHAIKQNSQLGKLNCTTI